MGELAFVGLGLNDERGVSEGAREVLSSSDVVFAEEYTAVAPTGTIERLEHRSRISLPLHPGYAC